nr:hypothetical protein [Pseudomonas sp. SST3]
MSTESTFGTSDNTPIPDATTGTTGTTAPLFDKSAHRRNLQAAQNALIEEFHTLIGDTERCSNIRRTPQALRLKSCAARSMPT